MDLIKDFDDMTASGPAKSSRMTRPLYWVGILSILALIMLSQATIYRPVSHHAPSDWILRTVIYFVVLLYAYFPFAIRRLHDTGRTGKWLFLLLIPGGFLVVMALLMQRSERRDNQYGWSPRSVTAAHAKEIRRGMSTAASA